MIGRTLAHYEITAKLGEGGMGEVYRARDTKLGRDVALKLLPALFANNPERMARMQREAKLLAAVNHPGIASIHGIEEDQGHTFLVMEVAEGEELGVRIKSGPLGLDQALDIAHQIAEGLEEAHAKGVVHRDLKPANVVVSAEGKVKILDFGLATSETVEGPGGSDSAHSPTLTAQFTQAGTILGTAAYMSPEQARGYPADKRADIWAFGVILFEMLSGRQLIQGDTVSDKLAAILKTPPDWDHLPGSTPPRIRELLERCLAKHRRDRLQDIGDARLEIEWTRQGRTGAAASVAGGRGIPLGRAALVAVLLCAVVGAGTWWLGSGKSPSAAKVSQTRSLTMQFPAELQVINTLAAPSGLQALFARPRNEEGENYSTYFRSLDSYETRPLAGSAGMVSGCFSHDSAWFAMIAPDKSQSTGLYLWKVPVDQSSPPLRVRNWSDAWRRNIHWLRDGDLMTVTHDGELVRISGDGQVSGSPVPIAPAELGPELTPAASTGTELPDGIHLMDSVQAWSAEGYAQHIGLVNVVTGEAKVIIENGSNPRWFADGHILFCRGASILAQPFDLKTLEARGGPVAVADGLRIDAAWKHGAFAVSDAGDLFYTAGGLVGQKRQLAWTDPEFQAYNLWGDDLRNFEMPPILSPDGSRFTIVTASAEGLFETWISETDQPALRRLVSEEGRDCMPTVWTPDGQDVVYVSLSARDYVVKTIAADGTSPPVELFSGEIELGNMRPSDFADGGTTMLVTRFGGGTTGIMLYPIGEGSSGSPPTRELLADASEGVVSPDGNWLAYTSSAAGRPEVYLRKWLGEGRLGPEITVAPGVEPFWVPVSTGSLPEVWFRDQGRYYAVSFGDGNRARLGKPRFVVEIADRLMGFDVDSNGRFLALLKGEDEAEPDELQVILGWGEEVRRRLAGSP